MYLVQISHSTTINDSEEKVWNTISSFDNVEKYFSIVTQTQVEGTGIGAKRKCAVNMGNQEFQSCELLESLDEKKHFMTVKLEDGPIQLRGMKFTYNVKKISDDRSDLLLLTDVENPDAGNMAKSIFSLIGQGLKKFHEM